MVWAGSQISLSECGHEMIQAGVCEAQCRVAAGAPSELGCVLGRLCCPACTNPPLSSLLRASGATCSALMTPRWWMPPCTGTQPASSTTPASPTATLGSSTSMARNTLSSLPCAKSTEGKSSLMTISSPLKTPATNCPVTAVPRSAGSF